MKVPDEHRALMKWECRDGIIYYDYCGNKSYGRAISEFYWNRDTYEDPELGRLYKTPFLLDTMLPDCAPLTWYYYAENSIHRSGIPA